MEVHVRPWDVEDAMPLHQLSMHPFYIRKRVWKYLYPDSLLHAVSTIYFYQNANHKKHMFRAITYGNEVCGYIEGTKRTHASCELSYWLGVPFWNRGIMKRAVSCMCKEIFHKMEVVSIYARVEKSNRASQNVLEYNGFQKEEYENFYVYKKYR